MVCQGKTAYSVPATRIHVWYICHACTIQNNYKYVHIPYIDLELAKDAWKAFQNYSPESSRELSDNLPVKKCWWFLPTHFKQKCAGRVNLNHFPSSFGRSELCKDLTHSIHVWYICAYICHKNQPNASKYTIHGLYGNEIRTYQMIQYVKLETPPIIVEVIFTTFELGSGFHSPFSTKDQDKHRKTRAIVLLVRFFHDPKNPDPSKDPQKWWNILSTYT